MLVLTRALIFFSLIGVIGVIGTAMHEASSFNSDTVTAQEPARILTTSPVPKPSSWTTTHTFSGKGLQKTDTFTVNGNWRIVWSCDPASANGPSYPVFIEVDSPDGTFLENGVDTRCQQNNTHGVNEVQASGQVYLKVISLGYWAVQVQEPE
jgi:hypothetical protein